MPLRRACSRSRRALPRLGRETDVVDRSMRRGRPRQPRRQPTVRIAGNVSGPARTVTPRDRTCADGDGPLRMASPRSSKPWGVRRPRASSICVGRWYMRGPWPRSSDRGSAKASPILRKLRVVLHVVIRQKIDPFLDEQGGRIRNFELKSIVSSVSGRDVSEFGTVRPRVQIPGPRPILNSESAISTIVQTRRGTAGAQIPGKPRA
jgi:hypothetical protein